jgi:hypothetical protein
LLELLGLLGLLGFTSVRGGRLEVGGGQAKTRLRLEVRGLRLNISVTLLRIVSPLSTFQRIYKAIEFSVYLFTTSSHFI